MRRWIPGIWLLAMSVVAAGQVAPPAINVSGDAEVRVVPDEVMINVGVESADKTLKVAKAANDAAMKRAIEVTRRFGVPPEHAQTDYISIEPRYHTNEVTGELLGYVVRKSLTVRLKEIGKFEDMFSELLNAGVNVVHGVEFRTSQLRKYRDQARLMAIKAAREKAEMLAQAAGRKLGETTSISEGGGGWYSPSGSWWGRGYNYAAQNAVQNTGGGSSEGGGSLAPGQITVTANVSMTIRLE